MTHTQKRFAPYLPPGTPIETVGVYTLVPLSHASFFEILLPLIENKELSLKTIAAVDLRLTKNTFRIHYLFGHAESHTFLDLYFDTTDTFPSLAGVRKQYAFYEREIATMFGLVPEQHPDPRPTMAHVSFAEHEYPLRHDVVPKGAGVADPLATYAFHTIDGDGMYEIPVGPVHAGIIEPGHFRFSVLGEEIRKLDPLLGWTHKGSEKLFETLPLDQKRTLSEQVSGDSSFAHSLAFCQALESLASTPPFEYDMLIRVVCAELERIANHFSDIGYIMLDTAYTFGGSHGARLRERVMQWNERLTSSRFLRGVNRIGGVAPIIDPKALPALLADLPHLAADFDEVIHIAMESLSFSQRLVRTGILTREVAEDYGVVGVPARAVGVTMDARKDFPYAAYETLNFEVVTETAGDVHARWLVRVGEVRQSISLMTQALTRLKDVSPVVHTRQIHFKKNARAISIVEGWRGEIVYYVETDAHGAIQRVKVRDPSFLNWQAFPTCVVGEVVPDFPLINKSFNLSYSGNDL